MVTVENVDFRYGKVPLFEKLSLAMAPGGIYGLLGRNGSGKTSLMKLFAGLRFPQAGKIEIMGHEPRSRSPEFLADMMFVPESFFAPAVQISHYVAQYAPFYPRFDPHFFARALREFGLSSEQNLAKLSYGQQKKAILAFALASGSRLTLLDEPTNGLDIPGKSEFRKLMVGAVQEDRVFVISTHQLHDVENLIDSVIILHGGHIVFNQRLCDIEQHLTFCRFAEEPAGDEILYCEKSVGGWAAISTTTETAAGENPVDLELLFKAVVEHRVSPFENIFKKSV